MRLDSGEVPEEESEAGVWGGQLGSQICQGNGSREGGCGSVYLCTLAALFSGPLTTPSPPPPALNKMRP